MEKSIHSREYALFLEVLVTTRVRAGLTQQSFAAKLNATQSFVSKCERGERRLDVVELRAWCKALGVEISDLVQRYDVACVDVDGAVLIARRNVVR